MMRHQFQLFIALAALQSPLSAWADERESIASDELPAAGPQAPLAGPATPQPPDAMTQRADPAQADPDPSAPEAFGLRSGEDGDGTIGVEQRSDIEALFALARIKQETGEYQEAIDVWEQALDRVQQRHGRWDERNVPALAGIGASYHGLEQYQEAVEHLGQAVYINRMNEGLHHVSQIEYLDQLTEIHALRNEWQEALQLQEYVYYVQQREHGAEAPELLPAIFRMADWYEHTGALLRARNLYEQAVEIVEQHYGEDDIRLVEPLQKLAMTYRFERYPDTRSERDAPAFRIETGGPSPEDEFHSGQSRTLYPYGAGERALLRSVEIQLNHPDTSAKDRAEAVIGLADWYLLFDKWNQAMDSYEQVHELLREAGWDDEEVAEVFAEPVALEFPFPEAPTPPPWTEGVRSHEGYVELQYDVTDRGRLRNLDIMAAEPEGLLDFRLKRAARAARFRPRFVDGEPTAATDVSYQHRYVYYTRPAEAAETADPGNDSSESLQEPARQDSE